MEEESLRTALRRACSSLTDEQCEQIERGLSLELYEAMLADFAHDLRAPELLMPIDGVPQWKMKEKEYAQREGCPVRTIRRWKAAGAPLDDPIALVKWKLSRRTLPASQRMRLRIAKPKKQMEMAA